MGAGDEYKPVLVLDRRMRRLSGTGTMDVLRSTNWLGDALMTLPAAYKISRLCRNLAVSSYSRLPALLRFGGLAPG